MNAIIRAATQYSRTVLSLLFVIMAIGVSSWLTIPKESEPDVSIPTMYVSTGLEGIAPEDAERLLLKPLEQELSSIEGLKTMTATGYQGGANVVLEFGAGFDADLALEDARSAVDDAKPNMPAEADEPKVHEINLSEAPIITMAVFGDIPEKALLQIMKRLQDKLESIPTVLEASLRGDREEVVEIQIDPSILQSYGLNLTEVLGLVGGANRLIAAGTLQTSSGSFDLKVPGLFEDVEDIFNLPVKSDGQSVVLFSDIADVRPTFKDPSSFARVNGQRTMTLDVSKRVGANIIETIEEVKRLVAEERETWPQGLKVRYLQDKSIQIRTMLNDLTNNVLAAVILVMIVIVGALGMRSGLLVGFAIPGSFLIGFMVLAALGFTVNMVVLFSLIMASGMLVDGAIVVVEDADRRLAAGQSRQQAYTAAAQRMAWPIISSTATTLAAFAPLAFWPGIMGEFMRYLPITLLITLSGSLFMALIFIPVLGMALETVVVILSIVFAIVIGATASIATQALLGGGDVTLLARLLAGIAGIVLAGLFALVTRYFLAIRIGKPKPEPQRATDIHGPIRLYTGILSLMLRVPYLVVIGIVALLIGSFAVYFGSSPKVEFFPEVEPESATMTVRARGNLSIYEKDALVRQVEQIALAHQRQHGEFSAIYAQSKAAASRDGAEAEDTIGSVQLEFTDWFAHRKASLILEELRSEAERIPGILVEVAKPEAGPPQGKAVQVEIRATNTDDIQPAVSHVLRGMHDIGGYRDIEDGLPLPGIDWELKVDREQAAIYGVDIAILGYYVRLVTNGVKISTYRPDGAEDEVDIVLRLPPQYRNLGQLDMLRVATQKGQVPLSLFLAREPKPKVGLLRRIDGDRVITVKAGIVDMIDGEKVYKDDKVRALETWIAENPLPGTASATFVGENEEQAEAMAFLSQAFMLALFIMAVILVTQFNNFYHALLILSAVILSTTGVVLGLYLTGSPFGVIMTGVGVISLAGIVVNNNIVLIDTFQQLVTKGLTIHETLVLTGAQRLRPVLLTTITTILGLMPMTLGWNIDFVTREFTVGAPSGQWWQAMASAIAYGLAFATVLTLFVTPCALKLQYDLRRMRYAVPPADQPAPTAEPEDEADHVPPVVTPETMAQALG